MDPRAFKLRFLTLGSRCALGVLVLLSIAFCPVQAQSPVELLKGILPSPTATTDVPLPPKQEIIPLAQPEDQGEIVVQQQGEGLITLKVRDASLKQVVAMIAETQRVNIVFSAKADTNVTVSMLGVPWQRALESILSASGYTWTLDEDIVFVTPVESADLVAPRAGGRRVETFILDFAKAVDVDQAVKGLLSPAGKSWIMESSVANNRQSREVIAVVDFPANLQQVAEYIYQIDQPPRQVMIKANILQVDLSDDCRSGVNLQQLVSFSGNQIQLNTVGMANPLASPATFLQLDGGSLDGLIELLKSTTDAKSLASTELLAVSGQESRIQSGQQLGYRITTTTQTSTLESVEFLDVGVVLSVTPQVTRDGRVLMRVKPEVSEGQINSNTGLPEEDTVEVETDVLLNNGQGLVIGGLIQELDSNQQSKVPWLGDIPYAGILFQRRQIVRSRSEIIVTLIPHVIPYCPIQQAHNDHRLMRTQDPLLCPPLYQNARPYEPKLPDTFYNPTPIFAHRHLRSAHAEVAEVTPEPTMVPSYETPQLTPDPEQGPLCFPPDGSLTPTPVPQQALRDYPQYR